MKRFLALLLTACLLMSLTACGGGKDEEEDSAAPEDVTDTADPAQEESPEEEEPEEEEPKEEETSQPEVTVYSLQETTVFHDGMACVIFRDDSNGTRCAGIIDTNGKMQHYFTGNLAARDTNQKGYMYSQTNDAFHVITPKGKVTTHKLGDNLRLAAYGDGFAAIEEHKSGFDAVEYVYHIYDDSGKELTTYSSGDRQVYEFTHIGEGTFFIRDASCQNDTANSYGYSTQCAHLYFAKSNVWHKNVVLSYPGYAAVDYSYRDGVFLIRGANINSSGNTHPGEFTYVNDQGEVQTLTVPADYGTQPKYLSHDSGTMLFYDTYTKQVYCYDVKAKTWTGYQGKYTEQMMPEYSVVGDGHVALCLRGADNNNYFMILDKNMKELLDSPVLGTPIATRDGILYAYTNSKTLLCYDLKGEKKCEIEDVNTYSNWYEEGIISNNQIEFFKPDGTSAFEVSFSGAKQIVLPE